MEKLSSTADAEPIANYYEVANDVEFDREQNPFTLEVKSDNAQRTKTWSIIVPVLIVATLQLLTLLVILILFGFTATSTCDCSNTNTEAVSQGICNVTLLEKEVADLKQILNSTEAVSQGICNVTLLEKEVADLKQLLNSTAVGVSETTGIVDDLRRLADDQALSSINNTDMLYQAVQSTQDNKDQLSFIVSTLSNMKQTGISTAGVADDILDIVEELLQLQNASSIFNSITPVSCQDIKAALPNSPSGYYLINSRNIYCNMEELCGSGGGWTRLAYLDMTDSTQNCPFGFNLRTSGDIRACGRAPSSGGSCTSVQFLSNGISFSQVCGRVVGYQFGSTDAVDPSTGVNAHDNINSYYVDGVSITRGSPRQHVWTLMAGLNEASIFYDGRYICPCSQGSTQNSTLQSFIGNDYYCESGNPTTGGAWQDILYTSDPLWDGIGCGSLEGNCCTAPDLPWFHKVLNTATTDYLELRVCGDEGNEGEDSPVSFYELYVK